MVGEGTTGNPKNRRLGVRVFVFSPLLSDHDAQSLALCSVDSIRLAFGIALTCSMNHKYAIGRQRWNGPVRHRGSTHNRGRK